jgi:RHS repeat-associated protein
MLALLFLAGKSAAQSSGTIRPTDGSTPLGMAPGTPAGSYALSGFDNINLYSGNLNFALPLLRVGGRGEAGYTMTLAVDQRWEVKHEMDLTGCSPGGCTFNHRYYAMPPLWEPILPGYGPGVLIGRQSGRPIQNCPSGFPTYQESLTRFTFMTADGTEFEFRDQATGGQPLTSFCNQTQGPSRGNVFVTADGTSAMFVCDETIFDDLFSTRKILKSGYIKFRNGVVYRINAGLVDWIRDRNGNMVKFSYDAQKRVTTIIDSLKKVITITYKTSGQPYDLISFKGFNGASRFIRIGGVDALGEPSLNILREDYRAGGFKTHQQLFPGVVPNFVTPFIPSKPGFVELPDGRKYRLYYNQYGEMARVELPTGGAFEYEWEGGPQSDSTGVLSGTGQAGFAEYNIYRRATHKRIYPDGGSLFANSAFETKIRFIKGTNQDGSEAEFINVEIRNTSNNLVSNTTHYHTGTPVSSFTIGPTSYPFWKNGREYKTETFDGSQGRRIETNWTVRVLHTWAGEDPRVGDTTTTFTDTNQVSKQHFDYDSSNNVTDTWEYDFGNGAFGSLRRHRKTTYMNTSGYAGTGAAAPLLLSLPVEEAVYDDLEQIKAKTTYEYDSYTAGLTDRSNISGHARTEPTPSFTNMYFTRGNVTNVTHWKLPLPGAGLSTRMQYDIAGNVTSITDPLSHTTSFIFNDSFGPPDGNARDNIQAPSELGTQATYAFASQVTNVAGHNSYSQRDYYTGGAVDGEDPNGVVTSGYYNDLLDRPTQIVQGSQSGSSLTAQTSFVYDDPGRSITTTTDQITFGDNQMVGQMFYDGLGRTTETRKSTPEGAIITKQEYDAMNRVVRSYNPRIAVSEATYGWTETSYDKLSRVTMVKTFDRFGTSTGSVLTGYSGNQVTVTDQAGRQRRSIADGLGRLTQVVEDPSGANYQTSYSYDVLDDLVKVTQIQQTPSITQTRYFMYDSLKRLVRAKNPEQDINTGLNLTDPVTGNGQWTMGYTYDDNNNLKTKTDSRSPAVITTYFYDALNRVTRQTYSDATPQVDYYYDNQALPAGFPAAFARGASIGRLVAVLYGGATSSTGSYQGYDVFGRAVTSFQTTDTQSYQMGYGYNLAGEMTTETYPSGRIVTTAYDTAGRISGLSGLKSGITTQYLNNVSYTAHGAIATAKLGNEKWEHTKFNNRLQPTEIGLGISGTDSGILKLEYGYGTTTNNGNVQTQKITAGVTVINQSYGYDGLNRLTSASENSGASWQQTYDLDRWGNRAVRSTSYMPMPSLTPQSATGTDFSAFNQSTNRLSQTKYPNVLYDGAGNLTRDQVARTFTYDGENRQKDFNSNTGQYFYDGDGRRIKSIVVGAEVVTTIYVYNIGGQLVAEYNNSTQQAAGGTSYLTNDHLGSTRVVTKGDGSVRTRYDFLPYGEEIPSSLGGRNGVGSYGGADSTKQKFTGYERDGESGLDYAQARYYSPAQGRFTSVDPLYFQFMMAIDPQRFNLYGYGRNNPFKFVDPTGEKLYLRGDLDWLITNVLYEEVGGQENFDKYFQIVDGQVVAREGANFSGANQGVWELLATVNAAENYVYFAGTSISDAEKALSLFKGARDKKGNPTFTGAAIEGALVGSPVPLIRLMASPGFVVGTTGREGSPQPANLPNGDPVFAVIAYNPKFERIQEAIDEEALQYADRATQSSGLGQIIRPVNIFIHETAENRSFAHMSPSQRSSWEGYRAAHGHAQVREKLIRQNLGITGGFAGGALIKLKE